MEKLEKLFELGSRMGLEGNELRTFIAEQQALEREERALEREREREKERDKEREHELNLKQLEVNANMYSNSSQISASQGVQISTTSSVPKLPPFVDEKDDLDSYLNRFERFANVFSCEFHYKKLTYL